MSTEDETNIALRLLSLVVVVRLEVRIRQARMSTAASRKTPRHCRERMVVLFSDSGQKAVNCILG